LGKPDCGLKTHQWNETKKALIEIVNAAKELRMMVLEKTI
jgi:5-methyltetrahydropteroyltriglutamate--homocysteine methyltransferase